MDEAISIAEELKETLLEKPNQKLMRYYYHLMGMMELEEGNFPYAVKHFKKALTMLSFQHSETDDHALFIYPLASAYYLSGDLESAQEQYRRMTSLTTGRLFYGDEFAKSFYMLGRIYQEKGQDEKAKKNYLHFIELWKDADPGMPEVEDTIDRLVQLEKVT
jgi:tetratricopeptide (TPR) repeat protein